MGPSSTSISSSNEGSGVASEPHPTSATKSASVHPLTRASIDAQRFESQGMG